MKNGIIIDNKIYSINTLREHVEALRALKNYIKNRTDIARNKYERTKNKMGSEWEFRKDLTEINEEYQRKLDELWKIKREIKREISENSKEDMNYYEKIVQEKRLTKKSKNAIITG